MAFDSLLRRNVPKTAVVERPGSEDARRAIENGLAEFVKVTQDLAELRSEHERALKICSKATTEITRLHEALAELKARCTTYQIERDESVSKYAKLQAFLTALYAQMRAFDVPVISANHLAKVDNASPPSPAQDYLNTTKAIGDFSVTKKWKTDVVTTEQP